KTLEEPPAHVVFILATTEVHKIPQTILSRCQRFDFRRIPLKQVAEYLRKICDLEKIKADVPALWLIAKQGEGSMRDSLSLLDQVISFTNGDLSEAQVSQVLGLTERTLVFEVFDALLGRRAQDMVSHLEKLSMSGQNPALFLEDLTKLVRHSLLLKVDNTATDMIDLPEDEISQLILKIMPVSYADLHMLFDMLLKSLQELKFSDDTQVIFEVALLRMSQAPSIADLKTLLGQAGPVTLNPSIAPSNATVQKALATPAKVQAQTTGSAPVSAEAARPKPNEELPKAPHNLNNEDWLQFVQILKTKDAFFGAQVEKLLFVGCENLKITLQPPQNLGFLAQQIQNVEFKQKLQGFIDSELAQGYTFEVLKSSAQSVGESASSLATKKVVKAEEDLMTKWQNDPRVQKAKEVFKSEIKLIKKTDQ
ncbi:MAG: DNA polymerase III subunit gamma/tau, partial [Bdellovibrionaceae bacterium]|nr:DNA polymerase III subunit gamma/tau [Pseudobdellovibrionaceae bacterium]